MTTKRSRNRTREEARKLFLSGEVETNQEIAARIGTVREIVSRTMARMAHDGAIRMDGRHLVILDRSRL